MQQFIDDLKKLYGDRVCILQDFVKQKGGQDPAAKELGIEQGNISVAISRGRKIVVFTDGYGKVERSIEIKPYPRNK
jgi:hypothetical protein